MRKKPDIADAILILCITILTFLASFHFNAFNEQFYRNEFIKHGVYEKFPGKDIDVINKGVLEYLRDDGNLDDAFLNKDEINHMQDVKRIVQKLYIFIYALLIITIALLIISYKKNKKTYQKCYYTQESQYYPSLH